MYSKFSSVTDILKFSWDSNSPLHALLNGKDNILLDYVYELQFIYDQISYIKNEYIPKYREPALAKIHDELSAVGVSSEDDLLNLIAVINNSLDSLEVVADDAVDNSVSDKLMALTEEYTPIIKPILDNIDIKSVRHFDTTEV